MSTDTRAPLGRILIVEDDPDSAEMLELALRHAGLEVSLAADGSSGISVAAGFHPQLVLCDLTLPGEVDGFAVARSLRGSLPGTQLVALTGHTDSEARERAVAAGFDDLIVKPVQLERVVALARSSCAAGVAGHA